MMGSDANAGMTFAGAIETSKTIESKMLIKGLAILFMMSPPSLKNRKLLLFSLSPRQI